MIPLRDKSVTRLPDHSRRRNLKICGSLVTPQNEHSAFQSSRETDVWSGKILEGTDILLIHGPPWNQFDGELRHAGCTHLMRPSLVVGYIHVYGREEVRLDRVRALYKSIIGGRSTDEEWQYSIDFSYIIPNRDFLRG
jgi:hypothetical protein